MSEINPLAIFATNNFALAVVLSTVGVPWADEGHRCSNEYSAEDLQKAGLTAEQAVANGSPGQVQWFFQRTDELSSILSDFDAIWKSKPGDDLNVPATSQRDAAKIVTMALKNRKTLVNDWKVPAPRVAIKRGSNGEKTVITKNTPPAVRKALGL